MAISQSSYGIVRIDEAAVRVSFSSDLATPVTFTVWHNGVLEATIVSTDGHGSIDIHAPEGEAHDIQVFDVAGSVCKPSFPGRVTLHWTAVAGADHYRIEQLVGVTWTLMATQADDGRQAWTWLSDFLDDVTTYSFRIKAVDIAGNEGTALSFSVEMVRVPDVPAVSYAWDDGTGKVTISAA